MAGDSYAGQRAALVVAHPGHELRVHGWIERARPLVFILTDGSGHTGQSRLASTTTVLERAGATPGLIYGRLSDRDVYRALLDHRFDLFADLADELAEALARAGVEVVVGDAVEGFNPGHDACRLVLNAAVERLASRPGSAMPANYEFPLEAAPDDCPADLRGARVRIELDDAALARKLAASRGYPEMAYEVERALSRHGEAPFRTEWFRPVRYGLDIGSVIEHPPFYEVHGEKRVAEGVYTEVLRFREHVAPLAERLSGQAVSRDAPY